MSKFQVGQQVVVVNAGQTYSTYQDMADRMNLTKYVPFQSPANQAQGKVVASLMHDMPSHGVCVGIEVGDKQYIVGEAGLELVSPSAVVLNTGWSFGGPREQWNTVKALCILLGYANGYRSNDGTLWRFIGTSYFSDGIVYTDTPRTHHFTDLGELVVFLLDDKAELKTLLAQKIAEVKELEAQIAA